MHLPDYHGGSIVNLMSSIGGALGDKSIYNQLRLLPSSEIKKYKNIVLIIIDGLGYEYIKDKKSFLNGSLKGSMTSVFLPTTACAITSFLTGVAPQQHAYTGWHMNLKEVGMVSEILPFRTRLGRMPLNKLGLGIGNVLDCRNFISKIKSKSFCILPKQLINSEFTKYTSKGAKRLGYQTLDGFFKQIRKSIKSSDKKKYIYAYWHMFDALSHEFGVGSKKSEKHFKELDNKFKKFFNNYKKDGKTLFIITADHGFINSPLSKIIKLENHPKLKECLTLPLCGEGRTVYCYVHPSKTKQFEKYVRTRLKKYCVLYKSQDLIDKNYFGLGKPNSKLLDRVGDYVLIFKENYLMKDFINDAERNEKQSIGRHAGVSKEEMLVPLIIVEG